MTNKIQVMVNEHNLPLKDFIEMFPDTNIVWLDNSKFYDSGIYYLIPNRLKLPNKFGEIQPI